MRVFILCEAFCKNQFVIFIAECQIIKEDLHNICDVV
jgi:hypothetical protein